MNIRHYILLLLITMSLIAIPSAHAELVLDSIQFDPAIIAAGDDVDIVIEYHEELSPTEDDERIGDPDWEFRVRLEPDDDLTRDHVLISDSVGDDLYGTVFSEARYNKRYHIKVLNDAPAADYQFKLTGQWYLNGQPRGGERFVRFFMPVKSEGIILDVANIVTSPAEVRAGDNYVQVTTNVENVGHKDAKRVVLDLEMPDGVRPAYADANRRWIGRVNAGESKQVDFAIDVDDNITPGTHDLMLRMDYMDLDDNEYLQDRVLPLYVEPRPHLVVTRSEGTGAAGGSGELKIYVRNDGRASAEAVDVRLLVNNIQPFSLDVRSDYIGELEPGEEGVAVFDIGVDRDAVTKDHDFQVLIRAKGDSDLGDDRVYTYTRSATYTVDGVAANYFVWIGVAAVVIVLLIVGWAYAKK